MTIRIPKNDKVPMPKFTLSEVKGESILGIWQVKKCEIAILGIDYLPFGGFLTTFDLSKGEWSDDAYFLSDLLEIPSEKEMARNKKLFQMYKSTIDSLNNEEKSN